MNPLRVILALSALIGFRSVSAAIVVEGANGTDGALVITTNTTIDLSAAVTGIWDSNNSANQGKGVYDPAKWAVVFKYSEVNIATGATVTFKNHPSRAPVVWLVSGNVTIDGVVSLDGQDAQPAPLLPEPGPGGFRGGADTLSLDSVTGSSGFGVGGGARWWNRGEFPSEGRGGSYGASGFGTGGGTTYGNPSIIPLIGGSGGGSVAGWNTPWGAFARGGGAGGGAILMGIVGQLELSGKITANGGDPEPGWPIGGAGGSGGAVRIIATGIQGTGSIECIGGVPGESAVGGGLGRVRIERVSTQGTASVSPAPSVVDIVDGSTATVWPPVGAPEVRVLSIGGQAAPADPRASFGTLGADVSLPLVTNTPVVVETMNVEQLSVVKVRGTPRANGNFQEVDATLTTVVSENPLVLRWTANLPVQAGYAAVQVRVIRP